MLTTAILQRQLGIGAVRGNQSNLNAYQGDEGSESEFGEHVGELLELDLIFWREPTFYA